MAFRTQYIHFKNQVMLFSLSNILATFQRYCNIVATWFHYVISLVITQQHFTKSTFTYYLILTNFPIYQTSFTYCEMLHWWKTSPFVLPDVIQLQFQLLLINFSLFKSCVEIWISLQILQLAKHQDKNQSRTVVCNWERQTLLSMHFAGA